MARDFGIAVYATENEDVAGVFARVGRNCDHVHIDLVDETMLPEAGAVRLANITEARRLWPRVPIALHVMSLSPERWVEATWSQVDWYLLHAEAATLELVRDIQRRGKRVGIAWRPGISFGRLATFLPHVDLAMVLGIAKPGRSGQELCPEALQIAAELDRLRDCHPFEVMFDGGVRTTNVAEIPAQYIVAASAVLLAEDPAGAANELRGTPVARRRAA